MRVCVRVGESERVCVWPPATTRGGMRAAGLDVTVKQELIPALSPGLLNTLSKTQGSLLKRGRSFWLKACHGAAGTFCDPQTHRLDDPD